MALILAWDRNLRSFIYDMRVKGQSGLSLIQTEANLRSNRQDGGNRRTRRRGTEIFAGCRALCGQDLAVDLYPENKPEEVTELWGADRLNDLLGESDVIFLAIPLNSETRGIFDAERLAKIKRGALLANLARGPLVDTDALIDALRSETRRIRLRRNLAGAAAQRFAPLGL